MYHSITIGDINTVDDWHIVAETPPVVNPPKVKTAILEIPGSSGVIDLSESLTGYPLYENRTGSWSFIILNDYFNWATIYEMILEYVHGRKHRIILEDDPEYFYEGRLAVNEYKSQKDNSIIVIDYDLGPYKWKVDSSIDEWKWDPFNFEKDYIQTDSFRDLKITSNDEYQRFDYTPGLIGLAPVSPIFHVSTISGEGMDARFVCEATGDDVSMHLKDGDTNAYEMVFTNKNISLYFKGEGTVSIEFRSGRL